MLPRRSIEKKQVAEKEPDRNISRREGTKEMDCREGVHSPGKRIAEEESGVFGGLRKKGLEKFFRCISI